MSDWPFVSNVVDPWLLAAGLPGWREALACRSF